MIAISLNQDISCEHICKRIQKLISNYTKDNNTLNDTILTIQITKIIDSQEENKVLRIESH